MPNNGLEAFKRRLAKVPAAIRKQTNAAIRQNAEEWVKMAKFLAPTDDSDGATQLRDSIRNYQTETGGQVVRAGGATTTKQGANGPTDYAVHQEWGTLRMPAHPYFWPAYRLLKKKFKSRQARAMNKALKDFNANG